MTTYSNTREAAQASAGTHDAARAGRANKGRLATASMVGTTLEWYDFTVYNTLAALVFNHLFFPSVDPLAGTILALSTYAVGYVSRPLGGFVFGNLGDKIGRRAVLVLTLVVMGLTTGLMGLLPTYASIGIWSPVLLVALRFVQGVALGGEWAGAVLLSVEHGDQRKRGLNASWTQVGPSFGTLLATGLIALITLAISPDDFLSWGWRVPFLLSLVLVGFGLWVRRGVEETPMFEQIQHSERKAEMPIADVFRSHWRNLLVAGGSRIGSDVLYALMVVFTLTYVTGTLHLSRPLALTAVLVGTACNARTVRLFGALSDKLGRRKVLVAAAILVFGIGTYLLLHADTVGAFYVVEVVLGLSYGAYLAVDLALVFEVLPDRMNTGKDLGVFNMANALPQSLAPGVGGFVLAKLGGGTDFTALLVMALVAAVIGAVLTMFIRSVK